jgi:hypothetical protein
MRKTLLIVLSITSRIFSQFAGGDGTSGNPYQISTQAQLDSVRNHLSSNYIITANLSLTGSWTPITNNLVAGFTGSFDGRGHTIKHLSLSAFSGSGDEYFAGLFGYCKDGAVVKNIVFDSCSIILNAPVFAKSHYVGLVCAYGNMNGVSWDSIIVRNSSVEYKSAAFVSNIYLGGIIGYSNASSFLCNRIAIENSLVYDSSYSSNQPKVGMLIGGSSGADTIKLSYIYNCTRTNFDLVAGRTSTFLYGGNGKITNCYARGTFASNSIASIFYNANVSYVYSDVAINSTNKYGFTNTQNSSQSTCYFDSTKAGTSVASYNPNGYTTANAKSQTNLQTQSTFAGWDFVTIWRIATTYNDGLPYLSWSYIVSNYYKRLRVRR